MAGKEKIQEEKQEQIEKPICGLVMPISSLDDCPEQHWLDVKCILIDVIELAGFKACLVSDADDVGIIQKRIIQNLYDNPIVICDVSGKNPNVMFELGIRLAFDKPTIIIKDDKTAYSFDTAPIEHLEYPRDLRFNKIIKFKTDLKVKIEGTHNKATTDKSYTTFLKHFGKFHVAQLETKEVSKEDYIIEELRELKRIVTQKDQSTSQSYLINKMRHQKLDLNSKLDGKKYMMTLEAFKDALDYFASKNIVLEFPKMEAEVIDYILGHYPFIPQLFDNPDDFSLYLHNIITNKR